MCPFERVWLRSPVRRIRRHQQQARMRHQPLRVDVLFGSKERPLPASPVRKGLGYFEVTVPRMIRRRLISAGPQRIRMDRRRKCRRHQRLVSNTRRSMLVKFYLVWLVEFVSSLCWSVRTGLKEIFSLAAPCLVALDVASLCAMMKDLI